MNTRREFIKSLGIAAVTIPLLPYLRPPSSLSAFQQECLAYAPYEFELLGPTGSIDILKAELIIDPNRCEVIRKAEPEHSQARTFLVARFMATERAVITEVIIRSRDHRVFQKQNVTPVTLDADDTFEIMFGINSLRG